MAAELKKVRTQFIKKVSKPVIKGLLDDLLEDGVLNNDEIDTVTEEYSGRPDQARCLIDLVWRKGDRGSGKMIAHLLERDLELHSELGLSTGSGQPAAPPTTPQLPQKEERRQVSSVLIPSTAEFKAGILQRKEHEIYVPLDKSVRKRLALLITNKVFEGCSDRRGADKDEENMERLLTAMGYKVVKHTNLTAQGIDKAVKEFSEREEHHSADGTFVVIMSHGKRGKILGVQSEEFLIDKIFTYLNTENCKALHDKPKVIIIQACQGDETGSVFVSDGPSEAVSVPSPQYLEDDSCSFRKHKEKDFALLKSCTPDTVSYRDPVKGSLMIQYIMEEFNTYASDEHIQELFRKVMRRFEDTDALPKHRQMPSLDRYTLSKLFYLFPGL